MDTELPALMSLPRTMQRSVLKQALVTCSTSSDECEDSKARPVHMPVESTTGQELSSRPPFYFSLARADSA